MICGAGACKGAITLVPMERATALTVRSKALGPLACSRRGPADQQTLKSRSAARPGSPLPSSPSTLLRLALSALARFWGWLLGGAAWARGACGLPCSLLVGGGGWWGAVVGGMWFAGLVVALGPAVWRAGQSVKRGTSWQLTNWCVIALET